MFREGRQEASAKQTGFYIFFFYAGTQLMYQLTEPSRARNSTIRNTKPTAKAAPPALCRYLNVRI